MDLNQFRQISVPVCVTHKSFNKVFGIGANKTGTTSLQGIFQIIGLNVANQQEGELYGVQAYRGNLKPLVEYINRHDAFQDAPFSLRSIYAQVDALFPGSKFILTYRDADAWFDSLHRFHKKIFGVPADMPIPADVVDNANYIYPGYMRLMGRLNWLNYFEGEVTLKTDRELYYNAEHYKQLYRARNQEIIRHFSERPNDLLVIDLTKETDTRKVVEFLDLPESLVTQVPHANKT
jgi:hypothetical protein